MLKYSEKEEKKWCKKIAKKVEWETVDFCQISNTISHDWRVYELKRCRAFGSFSFDTFLFFRVIVEWSTLGRWRLTVIFQRVIRRCVDATPGCPGDPGNPEVPGSLGDPETPECPGVCLHSARFLANCSFCKLLSSITANSNNEISVWIRGSFPFRVEWLLTTCRWIDSKKIRSLRVREMFCTFVRNLKMQEIPRLKILANETNF